ncbi:Cyanate permease [Draconibacterium orientale]|uniref:Cyanate permease n=1 Tax=Draconibacterium orientale TaxID=1168034 RepID=X5DIW7_9BACT|nr:MFS transporter [Draconibacterium orientale]AHW61059.1 MFS transporter [Draconibacterium orientale]SET70520.1 Cyanate permease [Draconibacterium orientale]
MKLKQKYNNFPFNPSKVPFFYGWVILFAATIGVLCSAPGQTTGVSTFTDYLIDSIGISRDQISTAYMFGTIGSSFILTYAGTLYDKYGARWVGMAAALTLGFVLVLFSQSDRIIKAIVPQSSPGYVAVAVATCIVFFFMLRFSGQGVITMVSRNMLMKWFIARRGLVNGISSVFVSMGFSIAPLSFDLLIEGTSWRWAWLLMAMGIGVGFFLFVFIFFRDNPEDCDQIPDGEKHGNKEHDVIIKPFKQFTLKEARSGLTFWLFVLPSAIYAMFITGYVFHLVSVFGEAGIDKEQALSVFIPISMISVVLAFVGGWISDRIKLQYLLYLMLAGMVVALIALANINTGFYYYAFIIGSGIPSGMYNVLLSVTWPRFYGRDHLGKITGFVMAIIVFFSALGPIVFSLSHSHLGSYSYAIYALLGIILVISAISFKAHNPQDKYEKQ